MRAIVSTLTLASLLAFGATVATAQSAGYTGPSNAPKPVAHGSYSGPSNVPLMSVKQLLDTGRDDQHARLQGQIVSHDGGDRYTFADATGRIAIEIDDEDFPAGQAISAEQRVELLGEFDKGLRKTEFEVDRITLLR
ncbi:NirD/YgiW/YdeI family stress tolerance protein [Acidovorax sp. CCYZU-2555]|uniref:YgiW/YdeI family stress tolerance OB fold protein n=1 Tax=Acidovorax sp. CCYZU-2555 TaxID=2835042 RepID=UPI001BCF032A|nr:NirD/YgiW/YdeI family stress tolerance protein [Acidovorax sp. CCYZU-2555]MBS7781084.1 NirD/YgiW/YdeI family stress tolerance protein [Acidovorax sp. CCYZU-2555]